MKLYLIVASMLLSASLAWSAVCQTTCPVTSQSQCLVQPACPVVQQPCAVPAPCGPITVLPATRTIASPTLGVSPTCSPCNVSRDTSCLLNELAALRGELRANRAEVAAIALQAQGLMLANRLDKLMSDEALFRQSITNNPNMPGAQLIAAKLYDDAVALNRDLIAFSQLLSSIPADSRPFLANSIGTFDTIYWTPTLQRFAQYINQFPTAAQAYQPAFSSVTWLNAWVCNYNAMLNNIAQVPQTYAACRWWPTVACVPTQTAVLGSVESTQNVSRVVLPSGSVVYIPPSMAVAGTSASYGACSTNVCPTTVCPTPCPTNVCPTPCPNPCATCPTPSCIAVGGVVYGTCGTTCSPSRFY